MTKTQKKCFANCHLTPEEFGFWEVCRSATYKYGGKLIFNGPKFAENFERTGKDAAYRILKQLVDLGWIVCTKPSLPGIGKRYSGEYQVLSHDEWVKKHNTNECRKLTNFTQSEDE